MNDINRTPLQIIDSRLYLHLDLSFRNVARVLYLLHLVSQVSIMHIQSIKNLILHPRLKKWKHIQ